MDAYIKDFPLGRVPKVVQGALAKLMEKAGKGVFLSCRILLHEKEAQTTGGDRVVIEPWRSDDLQFCAYFRNESWKGVLVLRRTIPQEEKNAIYLLLQSAGDCAFLEKPAIHSRKSEKQEESPLELPVAPLPEVFKEPEKQVLVEVVRGQEHVCDPQSPEEVPERKSPKGSLPDVCKQIVVEIGEKDAVPREILSGIIARFFAPLSPKGTVGPVLRLLQKQKIVIPTYSPGQQADGNGYKRPIGYSVDTAALRACSEGKSVTVCPKKKNEATLRRIPKPNADDIPTIPDIHRNMARITQALSDTEQQISLTERELARLSSRRTLLLQTRDSLEQVVEGLQKLGW